MLDRRGFLKFACGAGVGITATPVIWKSIDESSIWSQNWPWIPSPAKGESVYVPTISKICPSAQGIRVRLLGERPVTIHGDKDHPLSQGAISALAASEAQLLHSPARLKRPMLKGKDGGYMVISWEEAIKHLQDGLTKAKANGIWAVSGDATTTVNEILSSISANSGGKFFLMPGEEQPAQTAWNLMGGRGKLGYDIENSDLVLAIGASVLESWGTVVSNRKAWSKGRPAGEEPRFKLFYASQVQDNTASGADCWLPLKAGQELFLTLGIAHLLLRSGKSASLPTALPGVLSDANSFADLVKNFTPEKVASLTGISAEQLNLVVNSLLEAKAPLIIVGSPLNQGSSPAAIMGAIACNMLLGRLNMDGGLRTLADAPTVIPGAYNQTQMRSADLVQAVNQLEKEEKAPGAVIFYEANPVYAMPGSAKALLNKKPFSVAISCFMDETTKQCDLILPCAMGLERFDDAESPYGCGQVIYSLATPVIPPLYEARQGSDMLLDCARQLGINIKPVDMVEVLKTKVEVMGADWDSLCNGTPFTSRQVHSQEGLVFGAKVLTKAANELVKDQQQKHIALIPVSRLGTGTAQTGIPPYGVKLVNDREVNQGLSVVHMNKSTANTLGLRPMDVVSLKSGSAQCKAQVLLDEGVSENCISMLAGMGHTAFDAFSQNKGSNLVQLITAQFENATGMSVYNANFVTITKSLTI